MKKIIIVPIALASLTATLVLAKDKPIPFRDWLRLNANNSFGTGDPPESFSKSSARGSNAVPLLSEGFFLEPEIYDLKLYSPDYLQGSGTNNVNYYLSTMANANTGKRNSGCAPQPASATVVNVKDKNAKGDDITDDTAAIQSAIDQVAGTGGTVLVTDGIYMIDAISHLLLKNNMTFRMTKGAILKAIPNNQNNSGIIRIQNASNVTVIGGTLQGERSQHQGTTGEWGMGLEIYASKDVVVDGVIAKDNWGDGFYVGESALNILFCSVTADNNRRQGMSIVSADGVRVLDSVFKNTHGTLPMAGIDVEPDEGDIVKNVQILNSQFIHNNGSGIEATVRNELAGSAFVKNLTIDSNRVTNNGAIGTYSAGIKISRLSGQKITNNLVKDNAQDGIIIVSGSEDNIVSGNTVSGNGNKIDKNIGFGILLYDKSNRNTVTNNSVSGNLNRDISDYCGGNSVQNEPKQ